MSAIAVIGAASYEGRQLLLSLADSGQPFFGYDDSQKASDDIQAVDLDDAEAIAAAFKKDGITDVIHLPERGTVAKSLKNPLDAFEITLRPLMNVLRASAEMKVKRFVFSSTASVYGVPKRIPVPESAPLAPISPQGAAGAAAERMVKEVCNSQNMPWVILRYFNTAGADLQGRVGAADAPKHLITAAIHVALGRRKGPLKIYGQDYDTPDGTAIRDYVHVTDIAAAHIDAIEHLRSGGTPIILNCGYGEGASVQDVIQSVERVTGKPMETVVEGRREGDPPQLIADTATIRSVLGWRPRYNDLDLIIRTAIDWEREHGSSDADGS